MPEITADESLERRLSYENWKMYRALMSLLQEMYEENYISYETAVRMGAGVRNVILDREREQNE
jgi:hypothetical protein